MIEKMREYRIFMKQLDQFVNPPVIVNIFNLNQFFSFLIVDFYLARSQ